MRPAAEPPSRTTERERRAGGRCGALAFVFAISIAAPALADNETPTCLGRWVGQGQNGNSLPWDIDMVLSSAGSDCGTIEYDSSQLDCGGTLHRCAFNGARGSSVEAYSHNVGCAPAGRIEFRCEGDTMTWTWRGWETVTTRLRRVGGGAAVPSNDRAANDGVDRAEADREELDRDELPSSNDEPRPAPRSTGGCGGCAATPSSAAPLDAFGWALVLAWRFRSRGCGCSSVRARPRRARAARAPAERTSRSGPAAPS
jgi:hypothetical protein